VAPRSISAVLPAHNEAAVIAETVARTAAALRNQRLEAFEIIVVDDGSTDDTAGELESVAAATPELRVIRHPQNRGYGAALRSGFDAAAHDAVFFMDSDGQFAAEDIHRLISRWDAGSVVFGYRAQRRDPWIRRANHWAFFSLVRLLFGATTRDVNCAFKLFPRQVGRGLQCDGAVVGTELVLRARQLGYRVEEVAIPHHPRLTGSPTGAKPAVVVRAFAELIRLRRRVPARTATASRASEGRSASSH